MNASADINRDRDYSAATLLLENERLKAELAAALRVVEAARIFVGGLTFGELGELGMSKLDAAVREWESSKK